MYEQRIEHEGLKLYRVVKGSTPEDVRKRVEFQRSLWKQRWEAKCRTEQFRLDKIDRDKRRLRTAIGVEEAKIEAFAQTLAIHNHVSDLDFVLSSAPTAAHFEDIWEGFKRRDSFSGALPPRPFAPVASRRPEPTDKEFLWYEITASISILDLVLGRKKRKLEFQAATNDARRAAAEKLYDSSVAAWRHREDLLAVAYRSKLLVYAGRLAYLLAQKRSFEEEMAKDDENVATLHAEYMRKEISAIQIYITQVLAYSNFPAGFPNDFRIDLNPKSGTLAIDYELPNMACVPEVKEVKFVQTRHQFQEVQFSDAWRRKTYDDVLYKTCLRVISEIFLSDQIDALKTVVFNGWVDSVDRATGQDVHACVMSMSVGKDEFLAINLLNVEAKACFRKLKGISGSKLSDLCAVRPILSFNRNDPRFVPAYDVVDGVDERTNLAAMDWLDFENLIRQIFDQEFSRTGGEVKITRASRDGGVDAIAWDPDPIRGGKIVIQAKRYTNVVGVSAVRDLYGTVLNEGATKGILVTTSEFGADSFDFAKGKPITLLNGGALLYLLEQHGHRAKIDLQSAKITLAEQKASQS